MSPDCERYEALVDAGGPSDQASADFVSAHLAGCADCRELERALAAIALRPNDDDHFPLDALAQRRTVDAVLRGAQTAEGELGAATPRRWGRGVAAMAAGLLVLAGALLYLRQGPPPPRPQVAVAPTVPRVAPVTPPEPAPPMPSVAPMLARVLSVSGRDERSPGLEIAQGTVVQTGAATLGLAVPGQAWVRARPGTDFTFAKLTDHDLVLDLRAGHLDVHVPHGQGIDLSVRTPHGQVKVIGTAFALDTAKAKTRLVVVEGTVQVDAGGHQSRVSAGFALSLGAARPSMASKSELSSARESLAHEQLVSAGAGGLSVLSGKEVTVDSVSVGAAPVKLMLALGPHSVSRLDPRGRATRSTLVVVSGRESVITDRPPPAPEKVARGQVQPPASVTNAGGTGSPEPSVAPVDTSPAETTEQLLQQAQEARTQKDWRLAARAYSAIIERHPMSAAAEVARLSLGQLQVDQLGAPGQGQAQCETYIQRNPSGALLAEAELCQIRAFARLGQSANELAAIDSFLARWPNDFNAPRLVLRRAALQPATPH